MGKQQRHVQTAAIAQRCLREDHPEVLRTQLARRQAFQRAQREGFQLGRPGAKWLAKHQDYRAAGGAASRQWPSGIPSADQLYLHLPRARDLWDTVVRYAQLPVAGANLQVDLSQNIARRGRRVDGAVCSDLDCFWQSWSLQVGCTF